MKCRKRKTSAGFTLLEMVLVLIVVGLLLGGLMRPLLNNREQLKQRRAELQLSEARESLLGFAIRHGRLPCPASSASAGTSVVSADGCGQYAGYLPVVELGLSGSLDSSGLLLDPWSKRLHYSVSDSDSDADGRADFAVDNGMREAGLSQLAGSLKVFHWAGSDCETLQLRASHVVAVIYSDGKNTHNSKAELLNQAGAEEFSTGAFSQSTDCGFDDQLTWLSDSALFTQMLRAMQLP